MLAFSFSFQEDFHRLVDEVGPASVAFAASFAVGGLTYVSGAA
jgi:hypothetical protein